MENYRQIQFSGAMMMMNENVENNCEVCWLIVIELINNVNQFSSHDKKSIRMLRKLRILCRLVLVIFRKQLLIWSSV